MDQYLEIAFTNKGFVIGCACVLALIKTFYHEIEITSHELFPIFMIIFFISSLFIITPENAGLLVLLAIVLATSLHECVVKTQ